MKALMENAKIEDIEMRDQNYSWGLERWYKKDLESALDWLQTNNSLLSAGAFQKISNKLGQ